MDKKEQFCKSLNVLPGWLSSKEFCHSPRQETQVRSLYWEDPPEEEMATHSSILAWEMPRTEESGGLQSMRLPKSQTQLGHQTATTKTKCLWTFWLQSMGLPKSQTQLGHQTATTKTKCLWTLVSKGVLESHSNSFSLVILPTAHLTVYPGLMPLGMSSCHWASKSWSGMSSCHWASKSS